MRSFQGPVHIQKPMAVPDVFCALSSGLHVGHAAQLREVGRRRIIVQIDTGNVLGLELDRSEKVQSVKKKVQAALCVPTEQSALFFGDHVIENDLSEVRNDTPLLLTRGLHRSSSTPCLSPTLEVSPPKDWSQPVELVGTSECCSTIKKLIQESIEALDYGVDPVLASGGLGGAYYFKNSSGQSIAIVKPTDEEPFAPNNPKGFVGKVLGEPGLKRAIRVGETGIREVAACLLDYGHFARVPATALVKVRHSVFNVNKERSVSFQGGDGSPVAKIASFQQFVKHDSDASDIGTSRFPVSAVHRIGILDVRIFNTDRHGGNILVRKVVDDNKQGGWMGSSFELIPIDHGLCLPEMLDDPYFEWLHWPQASMPFSEEELEYINNLDPYEDAEMLRRELPMLREGCLRMLILCTIFLKNAARSGLTLAEIGAMMSRELCGDNEELSELEKVCIQAKLQVDKAMEEEAEESDLEVVDFEDDEDDDLLAFPLETEEDTDDVTTPTTPVLVSAAASRASSFEDASDDQDDLRETIVGELLKKNRSSGGFYVGGPPGGMLRPFGSPKYGTHKHRHDMNMKLRRFLSARNTTSFSHRYYSDAVTVSGSDKQTGAENLVFSQMEDEVWERFLDRFGVVLEDAFARRKATDNHLNFVQRLGTSCQF